ncbi:MAG: hypothetical protein K0R31_2433 [Clostridiales bacterium]|jgi:ABC-type amino acid transport substrate-binding protein|nr:hypothetical protein [Clostridiales bacterium]
MGVTNLFKSKKLASVLGMGLALTMLVSACGQSSASKDSTSTKNTTKSTRIEEIKKAGKLILATGNYRPFEYHDEKTDKIIGYDIDVAEKIAAKIGVPLEVREMQFTSLVPTLQNGQADFVIAAMYITDERRKVVDFAEPYMKTGMVIAVRSENSDIKTTDDLKGKVVGVKAGATSEKVAQELKDMGMNITIKSYKETVDYLLDLENGRLDAAINDLLNQLEYNKTHPNVKVVGDPFTNSELGIAIKKGDSELVELINSVLKEMKDSGESDKLYKKWLTNGK